MINETVVEKKNLILTILRDASTPVSGEILGKALQISRVAVHRHIRILIDYGYPIVSEKLGYSLDHSAPTLFTPWEFQPDERIFLLPETPSTMDEALRLYEKSIANDVCVASVTQTEGRGQRRKRWDSPIGGLWLSMALCPDASAISIHRFVLGAGIALQSLLLEQWKVKASFDWPNDIIFNNRKLAGILGEAYISGGRISRLILGIGINGNNKTLPGGISLKEIIGRDVDLISLLRQWKFFFQRLLKSGKLHSRFSAEWVTPYLAGIGTMRSVIANNRRWHGIMTGVDSYGSLLLKINDGSIISIYPGDKQ